MTGNIPINAERLTLLLAKINLLIASIPPTVGNAQHLAELTSLTNDIRRQMLEELNKITGPDNNPPGSPVSASNSPKPQSPLAAEK